MPLQFLGKDWWTEAAPCPCASWAVSCSKISTPVFPRYKCLYYYMVGEEGSTARPLDQPMVSRWSIPIPHAGFHPRTSPSSGVSSRHTQRTRVCQRLPQQQANHLLQSAVTRKHSRDHDDSRVSPRTVFLFAVVSATPGSTLH